MLDLVLRYPIISKTLLAQIRSVHRRTQKYFICDENIFSAAMAIRMFPIRCTRLSNGGTRSTSFLKPNKLIQNLLIQHRQMSQLDVNTNVQNNVILYKFERNKYFLRMKLFGAGQLFGWSILASYTYKPSFWDIFYTDIKMTKYISDHIFRLTIFLFSIFTGSAMFLFSYVICARTIKYIILNKGGKTLSIVTHHIRKKKSRMNIPVGMVTCNGNRQDMKGILSLKIKNKSFYYLVDKTGTFVNPKLFDHAMG